MHLRTAVFGDNKLRATVSVSSGLPYLVPVYAAETWLPEGAPSVALVKLTEWATEAYRAAYSTRLAQEALPWLNDNCGNAKAMQTMFPAVQTLIANISTDDMAGRYAAAERAKLDKRAARVTATKSIGDLPAMRPEARRALYTAGTLVNAFRLADAAPEVQAPVGGVRICAVDVTIGKGDLFGAFTPRGKR